MKIFRSLLALCLTVAGSTLLSGCGFLQAPEPEPLPAPVPTPAPGIFVPTDYNIAGIELNQAGSDKLPEYFDATRIDTGNLLWVRTVDVNQVGTPPKEQISYGAPDIVRLAGISVPQAGQPGAQESLDTLRRWTIGRKLTIQQDGKYPVDLENRRRVQIFFPGGEGGTQNLNLNRMMVRSGFAVVDIYEPTIFDVKGWLNDEEYARTNRLGLWKMNIVLQNRQPPPVKTTEVTVDASGAAAVAAPSTPAP